MFVDLKLQSILFIFILSISTCLGQTLREKVSTFFESIGCTSGTLCANDANQICSWTDEMILGVSEMFVFFFKKKKIYHFIEFI
jgi:hypothetical protein